MNNFEANFGFSDQQMGFNFPMIENPLDFHRDFLDPRLEGANNYGETSLMGQSSGWPIVVPEANVSQFQHGSSSGEPSLIPGWPDSFFTNTMFDMEERLRHELMLKDSEIDNLIQQNYALHQNLEAAVNYTLQQAQLAQAQRPLEDMDDEQSACRSSFGENEVVERGSEGEVEEKWMKIMLCRSCEKEEPCVLVMPCRHLCLCAACGSKIHVCPICQSDTTATIKINTVS